MIEQTYHRICNNSSMTDATSEAGTAHPSGLIDSYLLPFDLSGAHVLLMFFLTYFRMILVPNAISMSNDVRVI